MPKTFDKIWHEGTSYKLENNEIHGNALKLIELSHYNRHQGVVLYDQSSSWQSIRPGVPQGLALESLFSFIYINDLPQERNSEVKLFVVNTSLL